MLIRDLKTYSDWLKDGMQVQKGERMIGTDPESGLALFGSNQVKKILTQKEIEDLYWEETEAFADMCLDDPFMDINGEW
jgi:hypothetical protein